VYESQHSYDFQALQRQWTENAIKIVKAYIFIDQKELTFGS
jgi:hypothetical protein